MPFSTMQSEDIYYLVITTFSSIVLGLHNLDQEEINQLNIEKFYEEVALKVGMLRDNTHPDSNYTLTYNRFLEMLTTIFQVYNSKLFDQMLEIPSNCTSIYANTNGYTNKIIFVEPNLLRQKNLQEKIDSFKVVFILSSFSNEFQIYVPFHDIGDRGLISKMFLDFKEVYYGEIRKLLRSEMMFKEVFLNESLVESRLEFLKKDNEDVLNFEYFFDILSNLADTL